MIKWTGGALRPYGVHAKLVSMIERVYRANVVDLSLVIW